MSRPATQRLKVNPQQGIRPSLEFRRIPDLLIDDSYQRSIETGPSQSLVRRIAVNWDWSLCQPLVVARRDDGSLWVIDGQHRLAAARLRNDLYDLPCVVVPSRSPADEAAAFVALNQERRPLSKMDVFRAALEAGDEQAGIIQAAMDAHGYSLAKSTNPDTWKPLQITNVGGLQRCLALQGAVVLRRSLAVGAQAFEGQVLRYFGTIFPGIAAGVAALTRPIADDDVAFVAMVMGGGSQEEWRDDILKARALEPGLNMRAAAERAIARALAEARAEAGA